MQKQTGYKMGMFDYISVNNKDFACIDYQTKSLDNAMDEYLIKDNELLLVATLFDKKQYNPIKIVTGKQYKQNPCY